MLAQMRRERFTLGEPLRRRRIIAPPAAAARGAGPRANVMAQRGAPGNPRQEARVPPPTTPKGGCRMNSLNQGRDARPTTKDLTAPTTGHLIAGGKVSGTDVYSLDAEHIGSIE